MLRTLKFFVISLLVFLQTNNCVFAQTTSFPVEDWVKKLDAKKDIDNKNFRNILKELFKSDSTLRKPALAALQRHLASASFFYKARFHCLQAMLQSKPDKPEDKLQVKKLFETALAEAYETGDVDLISYISWRYGASMYGYKDLELAAIYCLNAVELNENFLKQTQAYAYSSLLGELLFHCREYDKSISYSRHAIAGWSDTTAKDGYIIKMWNTIGQCYQNLGMLDSALVNYERSMAIAKKANITVWKAVNSGFIGQVLFLKKEYARAKSLLAYDYNVNKDDQRNMAAYSLQWIARINLMQGKTDSALLQAKEALRLLAQGDPNFLQTNNFRQNAYYTMADIYRTMNNPDSFYHYFQLYINLHDSLERVVTRSSIDISKMRNDNEKNLFEIQLIQKEKRAELLVRNFIIAAIVFVSIIAFLYLNRSRMKLRYKEQISNAEIKAAKEQLQLFTQNVTEKTELVERLQQQLLTKELDQEQQELIVEISKNTILTEEDWEKFKTNFEKIYPGFFQKLMLRSVDITAAEQRLAALTRLHFTSKQISRMLGISVDSVHKTRQRLRHRLQLSGDANLKEFVAGF